MAFQKDNKRINLIRLPVSKGYFIVMEAASNGVQVRVYLDLTEQEVLDLTSEWRQEVFRARRERG